MRSFANRDYDSHPDTPTFRNNAVKHAFSLYIALVNVETKHRDGECTRSLLVTCRNRDSEGTRHAKHARDRVLLSGNRGNVRLLFMSHEMSNAEDDDDGEQSDDYTFWASGKSRDAMRVTQTHIEMQANALGCLYAAILIKSNIRTPR